MQEWIAVIDAAIEGVPEQVHKRRQTVNKVFAMRYKDKVQCTLYVPFFDYVSPSSFSIHILYGVFKASLLSHLFTFCLQLYHLCCSLSLFPPLSLSLPSFTLFSCLGEAVKG